MAARPLALGAASLLLTVPLLAQAANLVDLGANTTGYAINNAGKVAFSGGIYSNGTVTALPAIPGSLAPPVPVVSISATDGFLYQNGTSHLIQPFALPSGYQILSVTTPEGINDAGQITGGADNLDPGPGGGQLVRTRSRHS